MQFLSESEGLRPKRVNDVSSIRAIGQMAFKPFFLFKSSTDWMRPTHNGKGNLLYSVQMLISSRHNLTDIPRIMFNKISGHSVAQ